MYYWTKWPVGIWVSGVCECPVNLMLGPVIRTPLLDRMSNQLQFTLGNTEFLGRRFMFMLFYANFPQYFSYIVVVSFICEGNRSIWRKLHRPTASHWQTWSHNVALSTPCYEGDLNSHRTFIVGIHLLFFILNNRKYLHYIQYMYIVGRYNIHFSSFRNS
jgi:hypothetical protein